MAQYGTPSFSPAGDTLEAINSKKGSISDRFGNNRMKHLTTRSIVAVDDEKANDEKNPVTEKFKEEDAGCCGTNYTDSWRFRAPKFRGWDEFRFYLAEFVATLFFCTVVYLAQGDVNRRTGKFVSSPTSATLTDHFYIAAVRGIMAFICTAVFWNYGKAQFNPGVTFAFWVTGHGNFLSTLIRIAVQFVASTTAVGVVFALVGDPSVGRGPLPPAGGQENYVYFLFESLASIILFSFAIWPASTDRLFKEGVTRAKAVKKDLGELTTAWANGDGADNKNQPQLGTYSIPAEYQQSGFPVSVLAAITNGASYFVITLVGASILNGDIVLNFFLWFPRVFYLTDHSNTRFTQLMQGFTYFFTPLLCGLLAGLVMTLVMYLTRKCSFEAMETGEEEVLEEDAPYSA